MDGLPVGEAARRAGWSPRMLRYIEHAGLVVPRRTQTGYRLYGLRELNQLGSLRDLLGRFAIELSDVVFAARLRREDALRTAIDAWLANCVSSARSSCVKCLPSTSSSTSSTPMTWFFQFIGTLSTAENGLCSSKEAARWAQRR